MITGKEGLLQAMIEAYIREKGTNEFYTKASVKATDIEAKKAFSQLAQWEQEHMQYIQSLYQSIRDEREMLSFEDFEKRIIAESVEGDIPLKELEEDIGMYSFIDDLGALVIALEIEAKAYAFYKKLSETADDTNTKAFMKEMMQKEQKHIEYLKTLRYRIPETS